MSAHGIPGHRGVMAMRLFLMQHGEAKPEAEDLEPAEALVWFLGTAGLPVRLHTCNP